MKKKTTVLALAAFFLICAAESLLALQVALKEKEKREKEQEEMRKNTG